MALPTSKPLHITRVSAYGSGRRRCSHQQRLAIGALPQGALSRSA